MKKPPPRKFADAAEHHAAAYLKEKGYTILRQNYRYGHKEIDIICQKDKTIVFVEVKAARGDKYGRPESWVTSAKRRNLTVAALGYIQEKEIGDCDFRFDVITYRRAQGRLVMNHLESAFYAEESP